MFGLFMKDQVINNSNDAFVITTHRSELKRRTLVSTKSQCNQTILEVVIAITWYSTSGEEMRQCLSSWSSKKWENIIEKFKIML